MSTASQARATDTWTAFWADSGQSSCATGAPEIWQALERHWTSFSRSLGYGTRVLDLGCGACAVGRMVVRARSDLHVTGIDAAKVPATAHPQLAAMSHTAMEAMPFAARRFGAVVSQFGYEYSRIDESAREIARVLAPGAKVSFLVHHAQSAIVSATRARLDAIDEFLGPPLRAAFCSADAAALASRLSALVGKHSQDDLVAQLAQALPARLSSPPAQRVAIWTAIEQALTPERRLSEALGSCCVGQSQIGEWLGPLRVVCELLPPAVLREPNGDPIAWSIEGVCRPVHAGALS
jgi:SAM-dependent methyltransferase